MIFTGVNAGFEEGFYFFFGEGLNFGLAKAGRRDEGGRVGDLKFIMQPGEKRAEGDVDVANGFGGEGGC